MVVNREFIKQELDSLNDEQLKQVADFIASVKHRYQNLDANPWRLLFDSLQLFSDDFMASREQPALEVRESLE
ncbi:hypothetical protein [Microseira wollei]|nr:hypothetical protein [Microseira wollei]